MAKYTLHKVLALPATLLPNAIYYVKEGEGKFSQVITDVNGNIMESYTHPASHPISFITNLTQSLAAKVDNNKVLTDVPLNALFTDTVYDENISARRVLVPVSALPADFTSTDVMDWLNVNESIGDSEILFWETGIITNGYVTSGYVTSGYVSN